MICSFKSTNYIIINFLPMKTDFEFLTGQFILDIYDYTRSDHRRKYLPNIKTFYLYTLIH